MDSSDYVYGVHMNMYLICELSFSWFVRVVSLAFEKVEYFPLYIRTAAEVYSLLFGCNNLSLQFVSRLERQSISE